MYENIKDAQEVASCQQLEGVVVGARRWAMEGTVIKGIVDLIWASLLMRWRLEYQYLMGSPSLAKRVNAKKGPRRAIVYLVGSFDLQLPPNPMGLFLLPVL